MGNHLNYIEEVRMTVSEWEKTTNAAAQELVDILRKRGCTYHDAKAALSKAGTILERTILKAKV